ncbi:hypothetical protein GUJ93_ZPchr0016g2530 [Zizania palustris]|uniref:Uncharacterized protein n=1 Tax=Zizania palustris TaxID=103762 RepID=A0A8J5W6A0_ZIZPA|nr:hypothetical protein GUJ93_ZPchr0016g2530 [Zizania palustris]
MGVRLELASDVVEDEERWEKLEDTMARGAKLKATTFVTTELVSGRSPANAAADDSPYANVSFASSNMVPA